MSWISTWLALLWILAIANALYSNYNWAQMAYYKYYKPLQKYYRSIMKVLLPYLTLLYLTFSCSSVRRAKTNFCIDSRVEGRPPSRINFRSESRVEGCHWLEFIWPVRWSRLPANQNYFCQFAGRARKLRNFRVPISNILESIPSFEHFKGFGEKTNK